MSIGHPRQSGQSLVAYGLVLVATSVLVVFIYFLLFGSPVQQQGAIGFVLLCVAIWAISKLVPSTPTRISPREDEVAKAAPEEPKK